MFCAFLFVLIVFLHVHGHYEKNTKSKSNKHNDNDMVDKEENEEEEEEEDFDLQYLLNNNKSNSNNNNTLILDAETTVNVSKSRQVFLIDKLCVDIFTFVHIKQLINVFRKICKNFNKILSFSYSLNHTKLYFHYCYKFIKDIIERDICKFDTLGYWWIQTVNFSNNVILLTPRKSDSVAMDTKQANNSKNNTQEQNDICDDHDPIKNCLIQRKHHFICDVKMEHKLRDGTKFYKCNALTHVFSQLKYIERKTNSDDFMLNMMIDFLLLGYNFNIKPIKEFLLHLINKNCMFQNEVCHGTSTMRKDKDENGDTVYSTVSLNRLLAKSVCLVGLPYVSDKEWKGYLGFFMFTSMKGDFSIYCNFLRDVCKNNSVDIHNSRSALEGVFLIICLFLRNDLMDSYVHHDVWDGYCSNAHRCLCYLLEPDYLLRYKRNLLQHGISLSNKELFEFDLINNKRYHPIYRLKALKKLCFSSYFGISLNMAAENVSDMRVCKRLRRLIKEYYYKFECFQSQWHLMEYSDLKDDIDKQHKLHEHFKIIIQSLVSFCSLYETRIDRRIGNIIEAEVRPITLSLDTMDVDFHLRLNKIHTFIDIICPETRDGLESLYEFMKHDWDNQDIVDMTIQPEFDELFQRTATKNGWKNIGTPMILDKFEQPYLLFYKMWKIDLDNGLNEFQTISITMHE